MKLRLNENNIREVMLSSEQVKLLLKEAYAQNIHFYYVVLFALNTGMRRNEILSLQWSEINFESGIIRLSKEKTKSKKSRIIPLTPFLKEVLQGVETMSCDPSDKVFFLTANTLKKHWEKLLNKLSFGRLNDGSKLRFHDLRHCFAQLLLNEGVDLLDIQTLLGHQDFSTTQRRYAMFSRPDLHQKVQILDRILQ